MADFNGDGKPDLVQPSSNGLVRLLRNTSVAGGSPAIAIDAATVYNTGTGGTQCMAVADMDGNGKPDIITSNHYSSTISLMRNNPQDDPLPVRLISFSAKKTISGSVKLRMPTAPKTFRINP